MSDFKRMANDQSRDDVLFWRRRARRVIGGIETPCFIFATEPLARQRSRLITAFTGLPVRHWWSFKTLPLRPALAWWRDHGDPVEVVSEFEFLAARKLGFSEILINGPAKQEWLPRHPIPGLRVNLDSLNELTALAPMAARLQWRLGLRINTRAEKHPEFPGVRTQFGLTGEEVGSALRRLRTLGLEPEIVHFHLRTNVATPEEYGDAIGEVLNIATAAGWSPAVLDIGGGFPVERVRDAGDTPFDANFSLEKVRDVVAAALQRHPHIREVWMENGRWLTAPAAVLAVRVLDIKEPRGARILICDGGRTLHALLAIWERHRVVTLNARRGSMTATLVCGPTCMAFDHLGCHRLPTTVRPGDVLLWMDAGAYQLAWETRFSLGLAPIAWTSGDQIHRVRAPETFRSWWAAR